MSQYKIITEAGDLKDKRVLVRLDLNLPLVDGKVGNDYRVEKSLDTLNFLKNSGAKIIILAHIGRDKNETLRPVSDYLNNILPHKFISDIYADNAKQEVDSMSSGDILLFENLRQHDGEKNNSLEFVEYLASFGDIYVNEAFSNSHRDHASMTGLARKLPSYAGIRLDEEVKNLSKAFNPPTPFLLIVGGAKFETKLPLVKKFTSIANMVFLGGALSNDVFRLKGFAMDSSVTSDTPLSEIEDLVNTTKVMVPSDVVVNTREIKAPGQVLPEEIVMDAGPQSVEILKGLIRGAKLIVWNGPLGFYEKGFTDSTNAVVEAIIESEAQVVIGGGDIQSAVSGFDLPEKIFLSTGGGAMLDFLSNETLVAIEALKA